MTSKDFPPLHFLPAFEAAGRLGSFKAAAQLLHLTPSAISQQIKALEDSLGVALFERDGRGAKLTREGERYLAEVTQLLGSLTSAGKRLQNASGVSVLHVTTVDFVAYELLVPRLSSFRAKFPNIELRIEISMEVVGFDDPKLDAAIRFGRGSWPNLVAQRIGDSLTAVVCSTQLAERIHSVEEAMLVPLLEMRGQEHRGWHAYVKALGDAGRHIQVITLGTYFECMRAAEQGMGLAFGVFPLTTDWVLSGRLAVPLAARTSEPAEICWVCRPGDVDRPELVAVYGWLCEQYAQLTPLPEGRVPHGAA